MSQTPAAAILWCDLPAEPAPQAAPPAVDRVLLPQALYDSILRHARLDLARECAGLLLGRWTLAGKLTIRILAAPPALASTASLTHVVLHAESWPPVWRSLLPGSNTGELIGWYHSHPGHGAFLSTMDRITQATWFRQPWQVALVVDPIRAEMAAFHGPVGLRAELELLPNPQAPAHDNRYLTPAARDSSA